MAPILIVGGSFGGLCLAHRLAQRGIPAIVFEGHAADRQQNHGIALHPWAIKPLLSLLDQDEATLKASIAVDTARGGRGKLGSLHFDAGSGKPLPTATSSTPLSFRAFRPSLLKLLREHAGDVRYGKRFSSFEAHDKGVVVTFEDGSRVEGSLLVGADGVHSKVRRQLLPHIGFDISPYAVYYGQQHLAADDKRYHLLGEACELSAKNGSSTLTIKINELSPDTLMIGYTFSRPASQQDDPLLQPARLKEAAHDLPPQLLEEMRELSRQCAEPFASLLDPDRQKAESDRIVHWLQRSLRISLETLVDSTSKHVVLLGDAAHAMPLLTADGANYALLDAVRLGGAEGLDRDPAASAREYYRDSMPAWRKGMEEAETRLKNMHAA